VSDPGTIEEVMMHLQSLSPDVSIRYSDFTGKWYTSLSGVDVGGDGFLTGSSGGHAPTPAATLWSVFDELREVKYPKYIVGYPGCRERKHFRWNGVCFAVVGDRS
jgi:hypothetical protein